VPSKSAETQTICLARKHGGDEIFVREGRIDSSVKRLPLGWIDVVHQAKRVMLCVNVRGSERHQTSLVKEAASIHDKISDTTRCGIDYDTVKNAQLDAIPSLHFQRLDQWGFEAFRVEIAKMRCWLLIVCHELTRSNRWAIGSAPCKLGRRANLDSCS